jgi:hypothetical protein
MTPLDNINEQAAPLHLTDSEIFTMIWTKPRMVFRYLQEFHYDKFTYLLLFLTSVANSIQRATEKYADVESVFFILTMAIVVGGIFGVMFSYIYAAVTSQVGFWLGGKAKTQQLLRVFAYSSIPVVLTLPLLALQIVIFGDEMFRRDFEIDDYNTATTAVYFVSALIEVSLAIWSVCFAVIGISEVQKFSGARALGNIMLAGLLVVAGMLLLVMPFVLLKG